MEQGLVNFVSAVENLPGHNFYGRVLSIKGLLVECGGLEKVTSIGSRCKIITRLGAEIPAEVVGIRSNVTMLMPFKDLEGIGMGCVVWLMDADSGIYPNNDWRGRVINALAEPIDGKGLISRGEKNYPLRGVPIPSHSRQRVKGKIDLGVRSLNTFLTCCRGQRIGIFAGSGVGKSMLISMLTKYCNVDIKVIGLIGERGREVQEFLQEYLGEEGLKNAVVVVATGDESALMRRQAAYLTMTICEYFRDNGKDVICMMDSVTRFAMAQREIGLSAGEPPTTKGYTPTVFSEMPKLLERAGPGMEGQGAITGIFSVLVEGDDHNEPISDAARGILDGHIVLDRAIADRGRFPAVNILRSISRTMPGCNTDDENKLVAKAKSLMSTYNDMAELIRLGAYRRGVDAKVDDAIKYYDILEEFLRQKPTDRSSLQEGYEQLAKIFE